MYHRSSQEVATIAVACSGPEHGRVLNGPGGRRRSKNGALLQHTAADAELFISDASGPDARRCQEADGDLPQTQLLIDPSVAEFLGGVHLASQYVLRSRKAGDWNGGGITLCFSGHGAAHTGALVLKDGQVTASDLVRLLAQSTPRDDGTSLGVELFLDSCYSAAFLAEFVADSDESIIAPRDMWAASLHDELAWELDELGHGALTFAVLMPGNSYVDRDALAHAVHTGDSKYIRMALKSFVPNPVTFLTERDQHEVRLTNGHYLEVVGAGACELTDAARVSSDQILDALDRARNARPRERVRM